MKGVLTWRLLTTPLLLQLSSKTIVQLCPKSYLQELFPQHQPIEKNRVVNEEEDVFACIHILYMYVPLTTTLCICGAGDGAHSLTCSPSLPWQ
jgi:hypothetical protein